MELLVDDRENKIKDMINFNLNIKLTQLDIGDFLFKKDDETVILIERKTIPDLSSSIKTGRYREQKLRILNSSVPKDRIIYLIEGDLYKADKYKFCLPKKTLISAIINLIIRDNIKVIFTKDLEDTFKWLEIMYNKIEDNKLLSGGGEKEQKTQYLESIKSVKKENMNPMNCYIIQLSQIPGVSVKIATQISEKYKSFKNILESYEKLDTVKERELMLSELKNNNRKLGKVLSKRIYEYLYDVKE